MNQRWAVFISGRGSNLQAVLDENGRQQISLVLSSSASAYGILRAKRQGIPVEILSAPIDWPSVQKTLQRYRIQKIFLAGFMKIIPADFLQNWQGNIFNIHPSFLPKYPGLKSFEKAFSCGDELGVTVHHVTPGMDEGPRIFQKLAVSKQAVNSGIDMAKAQMQLSLCEQFLMRKAIQL